MYRAYRGQGRVRWWNGMRLRGKGKSVKGGLERNGEGRCGRREMDGKVEEK